MRYPKSTLLLFVALANLISCQKNEVQPNSEEKLALRAASPGANGYEVPLAAMPLLRLLLPVRLKLSTTMV